LIDRPANVPHSHSPLWQRWLNRLSIYGDFWPRLLSRAAQITPWFLEPFLIALYTTVFYLTCIPARRALLQNLRVLFPNDTILHRHTRAYRVLWNFACTLADAAHARSGLKLIDWEIDGLDHLNSLSGAPTGAIILTAHMGNYDLAAPLFASRLQRKLHLVRAPERQQENQNFASSQRDHMNSDWCTIHYNEPGNMLAVKLASLLKDNQIVAIQGDRILFDVAATTLPFSQNHDWRLPSGPFVLGLVSRVPLFPLFITRSGWRRYRITAHAPFHWPEGRLDKATALKNAELWWSHRLSETISQHWHQWFVFEPAFTDSERSRE
jgi:phosphatidylinositol dimannoside acyltransferase